jgi:hypothetical protein
MLLGALLNSFFFFMNFYYSTSQCCGSTSTTNLRASTTPNIGTINFTVSSLPFQSQCLNDTIFLYFDMDIRVSVDGLPSQSPMQETGLPIIDMNWFLNNQPVPITVLFTYNVDNSLFENNVWSFQLRDDQPTIGGTVSLGTCVVNQQNITASFSSKTFIEGQGFSDLGIPVVSGYPIITNNLSPYNKQN